MPPPLLIVNPASAGGRGGRLWTERGALLRARWPGLSVRVTGAPGDAETFARSWALEQPGSLVIALGGDGTVHEVLNGLAAGGFRTPLAIVPTGTGNDFVRSAGLETDPTRAMARLGEMAAGGPGAGTDPGSDRSGRRAADVGRVRFTTPAGAAATRVFANAASLGVVPRANRIAHVIRRVLPGKVCYRLGGLAALLGGRTGRYLVRSGGAVIHDGPALSVTFANGETFGGGMRIAPGASALDGALDLVAIGALGLPRALLALARAERGGHLRMRDVTMTRLRGAASVEGPLGDFLLEADGQEYTARGTVTVDVLPGALTLSG